MKSADGIPNPTMPVPSAPGPSARPTGSPCASSMSRRSGTTPSIRSGFPGWRRSNEFPPNPCPQPNRRKATGLDRITYAVAAARIADALTQDVLLAPLEAGVIPLPHQLHALTRAVTGDRVRYLLADEVGLGKTIEAGLIFRELKLRGLVKRVLVVAPKGLVTQWVQEMQTHFGEEFRLLTPSEFSVVAQPHRRRERLAAVRSGRLPRRFHQAGRTTTRLVPREAGSVQPGTPRRPDRRRLGFDHLRRSPPARRQHRTGRPLSPGQGSRRSRPVLALALGHAAPGQDRRLSAAHGPAGPGRVHRRRLDPQGKGRPVRDPHREAAGHQRPGRPALHAPADEAHARPLGERSTSSRSTSTSRSRSTFASATTRRCGRTASTSAS